MKDVRVDAVPYHYSVDAVDLLHEVSDVVRDRDNFGRSVSDVSQTCIRSCTSVVTPILVEGVREPCTRLEAVRKMYEGEAED